MSKFELRNTTFPLGIIHRNSILLPQSSEFSVRKLVFLIFLRQILISDRLRSKFEAATLKKNFLWFTNFSEYVTNTRKIKKKYLGI